MQCVYREKSERLVRVKVSRCSDADAWLWGTVCWLRSSCAVVYLLLSLWQLWDLAVCRLADTNSGWNRCWEEVRKNTGKRGRAFERERERGVQQKALLQNLVSRLQPDAFEGGIRHVSGTLSGERYICSMSVWYANRKVSVWAVSKRNLHSSYQTCISLFIPPPPPPCGAQKESF